MKEVITEVNKVDDEANDLILISDIQIVNFLDIQTKRMSMADSIQKYNSNKMVVYLIYHGNGRYGH